MELFDNFPFVSASCFLSHLNELKTVNVHAYHSWFGAAWVNGNEVFSSAWLVFAS